MNAVLSSFFFVVARCQQCQATWLNSLWRDS